LKLIIAIVQSEDADRLCEQLNQGGLRVTRINSAGGFLARGNVTILTGVDDERVADVITAIHATCHARRAYVNAMPWAFDPMHVAAASALPLEVEVGGATIFQLPIKRFLRLRGGAVPTDADELYASPPGEAPGSGIDVVLAIVQSEDADAVSQAVLNAGFGLTRISTTGAFLRRGNATLVVGVQPEKVDLVLELIQRNCKPRAEATPLGSGMPMFSAAVFVLEGSTMMRV
jgi:uncharacterized protein YaaQ